jgi:hypothetical protein
MWRHATKSGELVMRDLALPAFAMDCRVWLVISPADAGVPDEVDGAPLLAVLSTVVLGGDSFRPATGLLTVGLFDGEDAAEAHAMDDDSPAVELLDDEGLRFVLPVPGGPLALLAEFTVPDPSDPAVTGRVRALMQSFRWAAW